MARIGDNRHRLNHRLNRNPLDKRHREIRKVSKEMQNQFVLLGEIRDIVRKEKIANMLIQKMEEERKELANRRAVKEERVTVEA